MSARGIWYSQAQWKPNYSEVGNPTHVAYGEWPSKTICGVSIDHRCWQYTEAGDNDSASCKRCIKAERSKP